MRMPKVLLVLLVTMSLLAITGCTIGVKQKTNNVMHDPIPIPESAKGTVRVNTNKPIPLVIDGMNDKDFEKDVGGYVVVTPGWYGALVDNWNKTHPKK